MAEYSLTAFSQLLNDLLYKYFPYENNYLKRIKHPDKPLHIRDVAFRENGIVYSPLGEQAIMDIGNERAERDYPYYHILEDAPVIKKPGHGTKKTKGSQAQIENLGKRDYGKIDFNGKTFTKEYTRNVRGKRLNLSKISHYVEYDYGKKVFINREAESYLNIWYHYIEKILNNRIVDELANKFELKRKRTQRTNLYDDWNYEQENQDLLSYDNIDSYGIVDITEILDSYE